MSTIEKCDKIFVLEDGKVKEEGGFEELKAAGGFFAKLQLRSPRVTSAPRSHSACTIRLD